MTAAVVFANNTNGTVSSGGTTAPSSGSSESWTVTVISGFPTTLGTGQVFHVADPALPAEKVLVTAVSGSGPYTWTVTRGDESTATAAHTSGFTVQQVVTAGDLGNLTQSQYEVTADYVIALVSSVVICTKTAGGIIYAGSDGGAALTAALSDLGTNAGVIRFRAGTYTWSSVPALPRSLPGWLKIMGEPGTTIALSSSGRRFLDFNRIAVGDTFQYIWIEGITVDCTNISALTGTQHVFIGTYQNSGQSTALRINFDHITIRFCRILNAFGGANATAEQLAIWLDVTQDAGGQPLNTLTNILVEHIEITGCNYGIYVGGDSTGAFDPNIFVDKVRIRDFYHDVGNDPPQFDAYAHVQIGGGAGVGTAWVERVWGRGSRDVGIEIDNALDCRIRDCYFLNTHGHVLAITNFLAPSDINQQHVWAEDITLIRNAGVWDSGTSSLVGLVSANNAAGTPQAFGHFTARNLKMYVDGSSLTDIVADTVNGDFINCSLQPLECDIQGGRYYATGYRQLGTGASGNPTVVYTQAPSGGAAAQMKFTLKDIDIFLNVNNLGTTKAGPTLIRLNGQMALDMDNVSISCSATSDGTNNATGMMLGQDFSSTMTGTIRRLKFNTFSDTQATGIRFVGTAGLTILDKILVEDCDFSGMTGTSLELYFPATSNAAKVHARRNNWIAYPKLAYSLGTVPSSGSTGVQYVETWPATLACSATAITAMSVSVDNTNYFSVFPTGVSGTVTAFSFHIEPGQYIKATYTSTLTIKVIPDP